ncbi:hypothetical protein PABG_11343 [Paracoccidioides brasiliensis Pb03]|uniref:Stress-associated endoplasmic reticulum protein n=2 Tax=Paracoccidioides brasiliensis TaxID=121759 RepID=A0A0A0HVT7_PARBD|nr:uncharacterized protein PADG_11693 [Paracoccidioides brasiliensis Pb18]KGM92156.1 hypothetical protein PADG_11693 [Paracoccidioides brasiliensis Pb18]KGY15689.1 hypothetical protein PABG_11343 [Paracoccidioides brasiliensis Pb03]ODH21455.1 hypothetical protein ACO22_05662 [Paracoccidioides brasiliensis]
MLIDPHCILQAQTPQQRRANERYAKLEAAKRGKPDTGIKTKPKKSPIPVGWVVVLAFVVCGGMLFELLGVVPELWGAISAFLTKRTS